MTVRSYRWTIGVLACVTAILCWRWWIYVGQVSNADFIDKQCKITQEIFRDSSQDKPVDKSFLTMRLEFLVNYYESRSNTLAGSELEQIVRRDYEQAIADALVVLRRETTNNLGDDPHAWIQKYGQ